MTEKKLVRLKSTLSFCGRIERSIIDEKKGFYIKPSDNSEVRVWIPLDEVDLLFHGDGSVVKGDEINASRI